MTDGTPCVATHGWRQQSKLSLWDAVARLSSNREPRARALHRHEPRRRARRPECGAVHGGRAALSADRSGRPPAACAMRRDLHALAECGVGGAISGKALLEGRIPIEELRPFLPNA